MQQFLVFICVLAFFHLSEFLLAFVYMRQELGWSSFLFSKTYCIAMSTALVEYLLECWLFPGLKSLQMVSTIGLVFVIVGEAVRKCGMITAKSNFTHKIRYEQSDEHQLVDYGIYRHAGQFHASG